MNGGRVKDLLLCTILLWSIRFLLNVGETWALLGTKVSPEGFIGFTFTDFHVQKTYLLSLGHFLHMMWLGPSQKIAGSWEERLLGCSCLLCSAKLSCTKFLQDCSLKWASSLATIHYCACLMNRHFSSKMSWANSCTESSLWRSLRTFCPGWGAVKI